METQALVQLYCIEIKSVFFVPNTLHCKCELLESIISCRLFYDPYSPWKKCLQLTERKTQHVEHCDKDGGTCHLLNEEVGTS